LISQITLSGPMGWTFNKAHPSSDFSNFCVNLIFLISELPFFLFRPKWCCIHFVCKHSVSISISVSQHSIFSNKLVCCYLDNKSKLRDLNPKKYTCLLLSNFLTYHLKMSQLSKTFTFNRFFISWSIPKSQLQFYLCWTELELLNCQVMEDFQRVI